jgi:hypothetical protein
VIWRRVTGSAAWPKAITVYDGARSYKDMSLITKQGLLPDLFGKITRSLRFGDSGGPLFTTAYSWRSMCSG